MKWTICIQRLLTVFLAVYAAAGMCRAGAALTEEGRRKEALQQSCREAEAEILALKSAARQAPLQDRAWQLWGYVSPGDVVFYDAGWTAEGEYAFASNIKEDKTLVWSLQLEQFWKVK